METSQSNQQHAEGPPYPSFGELKDEGVRVIFSPVTERLYWEFDGVFPAAIYVMKSDKGASDDLEPFFRPDTGTWHEIAQLPLTEPKVSSLEASVYDFGDWVYDWVEWHEHHGAPEYGQEYVAYGDLDDDIRPHVKEPKEDDSDTEILMKCCGENRPLPPGGPTLVVRASQSAGSESFVTVRDFVSAVHPWLMSLRDDIFKAKYYSHENAYLPPERYEWMVDVMRHWGGKLEIEEKREWVRGHSPYTRRPGDPPLTPALLAHLAQKRAMREAGIPLVP